MKWVCFAQQFPDFKLIFHGNGRGGGNGGGGGGGSPRWSRGLGWVVAKTNIEEISNILFQTLSRTEYSI